MFPTYDAFISAPMEMSTSYVGRWTMP